MTRLLKKGPVASDRLMTRECKCNLLPSFDFVYIPTLLMLVLKPTIVSILPFVSLPSPESSGSVPGPWPQKKGIHLDAVAPRRPGFGAGTEGKTAVCRSLASSTTASVMSVHRRPFELPRCGVGRC